MSTRRSDINQLLPIEIALEKQCQARESEIQVLQEQNAALVARLSELRDRSVDIFAFEEFATQKDQDIAALVSAQVALQQSAQAAHAKLAESNAELAHAQAQASQAKNELALQTSLQTSSQSEQTKLIRRLELALSRSHEETRIAVDELNRKLASLADLNWHKDLENTELRKQLSERETQAAALASDSQKHEELLNELAAQKAELTRNQAAYEKIARELETALRMRDRQPETKQENVEVTKLEAQLRKANEENAELRAEAVRNQVALQCARFDGERAVHSAQTQFAQDLNQRLTAERETFERRRADRDAELGARFSAELERAAVTEQKLRADFDKVETRFHAVEADLRRHLVDSQIECSSLRGQIELQKEQLGILRSERAKAETEQARSVELTAQLREQLFVKQSELMSMRDERASERNEARGELEAMKRALDAAEHREITVKDTNDRAFELLAGEISSINDVVAELRRTLAERESEKLKLTRELESLTKQFTSTESETREEIARLQKLAAAAERRELSAVKAYESAVEDFTKQLSDANEAASALRRQLGEDSARETRADERLQQLELHDRQLRVYAAVLSREKAELKNAGQKLVREIQLLSATHPLKDYLAATEFEIAKVEIRLKTTPTLSPERPLLEEGVTKLVEQREFLRAVLQGAKKSYDRQASHLEALLGSALATVALPPPPPAPQTARAPRPSVHSAAVAAPQTKSAAQGPDEVINAKWEKPFEQII